MGPAGRGGRDRTAASPVSARNELTRTIDADGRYVILREILALMSAHRARSCRRSKSSPFLDDAAGFGPASLEGYVTTPDGDCVPVNLDDR